MATSTQICNATAHLVRLQVGSARNASDLAMIAAGGKHAIAVDFNATYREYIIGVDVPGRQLEKTVFSSDDLCDSKCITIKEADDGKLTLEKEPRQSTDAADAPSQTAKKSKWVPAWLTSRLER